MGCDTRLPYLAGDGFCRTSDLEGHVTLVTVSVAAGVVCFFSPRSLPGQFVGPVIFRDRGIREIADLKRNP